MKKVFLTLAVFVMAICANAQKNQYFWYQGNLMMGNPIAQIDSVTFGEGEPADTLHIMLPRTIIKTVHDTVYVTVHDTIKPNTEGDKTTYNGHEYVDLGLPSGTLWATCNVDAASPDQLGGYYGWGCLTPYPGTYCGNIPVSNISGTEYDVARVKWGGEWRMPTNEECLELAANCSRKDTTINGKSGIVVRGTNNNYIFIPGSGYCGEDAYVQDAGGPGFWTSTGGPTYPYRVWEWINNSFSAAAQGWQIRPVVSKTDDVISQTETISGAQIVHDTVYITIHDTVCPNEKIEGVLPGEFSVSATKKVRFSSGNLQFNAALGSHQCADGTTKQGTWRFAEQQYDYVGKDNEKRSATYSGWIDLFCWGTSGYNNKYPYMDSYYYADYGDGDNDIENTYYDWGLYNEISNDGGNMGKWYTLNKDEWNYLFNYRTNANQLCCVATIDTIKGCLLFPDNWNSTDYSFIMNNTDCSENILTFEEWKTLEKLNVVFLPAAGRLQDEAAYSSQSRPTQYYEGGIVYWSTIHYSSHSAYGIALPREDWTTIVGNIGWRYYGTPVRLVIPVE